MSCLGEAPDTKNPSGPRDWGSWLALIVVASALGTAVTAGYMGVLRPDADAQVAKNISAPGDSEYVGDVKYIEVITSSDYKHNTRSQIYTVRGRMFVVEGYATGEGPVAYDEPSRFVWVQQRYGGWAGWKEVRP